MIRDGQLLTGSYMDYALPRASDLPALGLLEPSRSGANQFSRCERLRRSRCAGSLPAVMNAVVDALAEFGIMQHRHHRRRHTGSGKPSMRLKTRTDRLGYSA